nr:RAMP superfamily CRISPR-associated protein [Ardenticatena sp.]
MKREFRREFWAEFDLYSEPKKRDLIHYFVGKPRRNGESPQPPERQNAQLSWELLEDQAVRQHILAQLLASEKECARKTKCKDYAKGKNGLQWWYYAGDLEHPRGDFQGFLCRRMRWMASILGFVNQEITGAPTLPDLSRFPPGTWAVQVTFTLRKPYISRDDVDFYILDNPVKKEWVFKVPYVAPSQWKGALRSAMVRELVGQLQAGTLDESAFTEQRLQIYRLFGNEKDGTAAFLNRALARHRMGPLPEDADDATQRRWQQRFEEAIRTVAGEFEQALREKTYRIGEIEGFQGCLYFYPTFFDRIGLEVINPHPRDTGAGKQPIYFECVPTGAEGTFTLLYVPLGGPETSPDEARRQAAEDLQAVVAGVEAMMTRYGFGAKTSSGYGVVAEEFVKDEQGRSQAIIRVENGKGFLCRSFTGLRQAAAKLVKELGHDA